MIVQGWWGGGGMSAGGTNKINVAAFFNLKY